MDGYNWLTDFSEINMGMDQVVVMGVLIIVLITLFVMTFDFLVPLMTKLEYDAVCRKYMLLAEAHNGLRATDKADLEMELIDMGLAEINIECGLQNQMKRGEKNEFRVESTYASSWFTTLFKRSEKQQKMVFHQTFMARKIIM